MNTIARPVPGASSQASTGLASQSSAKSWGHFFIALILVTWSASFLIGFKASLTILTLAGFAAATLGLRRPPLGLFGISMLCTLDIPASVFLLTGGLLRWNTVNYWLLVVMLLSVPFLLRLKDQQTRLMQAFVLLLGLQLAITPDFLRGAEHLLEVVILFGLLVYLANPGEDKQIWYWLGLVNGTLAGAGGFAFFLQLNNLPAINPNAWAFFPLTGLFMICLAFPVAVRQSQRMFGLALLAILNLAVVNFTWLFLSASRGAFLIALLCFFFMALSIRSFWRRVGFLIIVAALGFAISSQFPSLHAYALKRVNLLLDPTTSVEGRTSGRSDLAEAGWYIFLNHPLGVGTGGFAKTYASLGSLGGQLTYRLVGEERQAHSGWIKILAENGILGILLLSSYVLSFSVVGWRKSKDKTDHNLLLLGFLVTAVLSVAFISTEFQGKGLWFLAAAAMTLFHREEIFKHLRDLSRREDLPNPEHLGVVHRG